MAWKKLKSRSKVKRYKRFSAQNVHIRSQSGPSKNGVFTGGRTIPIDAEAGFDYRRRGTKTEKEIERDEWLHRLFNIDGANERPTTDIIRRQLRKEHTREEFLTQHKRLGLERLTQFKLYWSGEYRMHKIQTWNSVVLVPGYFFTKMFFEGTHYIILQHGLDHLVRRSIVYSDREKIMRDFHNNTLLWAEFFDLSSEPALQSGPPSPD